MAQAKTRSSAKKKSPSRASNGGSAASRSSSGAKSTVAEVGQKVAAPLSKVKGPGVAGAATAAGLVGGAVIGMKYAGRRKRVLGVPIPGTGNGLARQVKKAIT
jgi:hypothetical protein